LLLASSSFLLPSPPLPLQHPTPPSPLFVLFSGMSSHNRRPAAVIEPGDDVANAKMVCTGFGHGGDGRKPFLHAFSKRPGQNDQLVMVYPQASAESAVRNQIRTWGAAADGLCAGPGPTPRAEDPPGGLLLSTFGVRIACRSPRGKPRAAFFSS